MLKKLPFLLKIAAGLAVFLIAAAAVATYALKKYLPPEKVRGLILDNSRKVINREVRLKDLDLSVLNGMAITGLEISEAPDFKAGTFAQADSFQLRVQLLPLLHATVAVDRVALGGLRLTVKKGADGLYNFSDLAGSTASAKTASPAKALPLLLDIRHAAVSDGKISYRDAGTGDSLEVSEISAELSDLSISGDTQADFSFKTSGTMSKKPIHASVSFSGSINPARLDLDKVAVSMKKATIEVPQVKLSVSGTIKGARSPVIDLKTEAALPGMDAMTAEISGKLSDFSSGAPSASLSVKAHTPNLKSGDFKAYGAPDGLLLPPADVETKFELAGDMLTLKSLNLKTKGVSAEISGTVGSVKTAPKPDLTVAAKLDVPSLKSGDLAFLKSFKVQVPENLAVPAFKADINFGLKDDDAALKAVHLEAAGAVFDVSGAVRRLKSGNPDPDLTIAAKVKVPALTASDLAFLKDFKVSIPASLATPAADIDAQFHFQGDLLDLKAFHLKSEFAALDASGAVRKIKSGKPEPDLTVSAKVHSPRLGPAELAVLKTFKLEVPQDVSVPAADIEAEFHVSANAAEVKSFHLKSQGSVVDASGKVSGLVSGPLDPAFDISANLSIPELKAADVSFLKAFKVEVPAEMALPPTSVETKLHYTPQELSVSAFHVKNKYAEATASGSARRLKSGRREGSVDGSVTLHIPQVTARDLAVLKMIPKLNIPATLAWPASEAEAQFSFNGEDLDLKKLRVENPLVRIRAVGGVRKILEAPEPRLDVEAKTDLPAFTSADIAFLPGVPPNLKIPASHFELLVKVDPDKVSLKTLNLHTASNLNDFNITESGVAGYRTDNPLIVLHIDGKFNLDELKKFTPETQAIADLTGGGSVLDFSVGGHIPKGQPPNIGIKKGRVAFSGLGATVAGLHFSDFTADFDFNDRSHTIESKKIKGKIGPGTLEMDLTVKNFNAPSGDLSVEMQSATLDQFDIGAFLAAKNSLGGINAAPAGSPVEIKPFGFKVFDGLTIGTLVHPYAIVNKANLKCDLTGITPDFKRLNGTAHFTVGGGHLLDLDRIAAQSPLFKVLTIPILVLRGIGFFPNLRDIGFYGITGDYKITDGLVEINEFHLDGDKLQVKMNSGRVDLAHDKVDLDVYMKAGIIGMNKVICGSITKPDTACVGGELKKKVGAAGKAFDKGSDAVQEGAKKLFDSVFKK